MLKIIDSVVDKEKSMVYVSFIIKSVIIHRRVLTEIELRLGLGVQSTIVFMLHDVEERKKNINEKRRKTYNIIQVMNYCILKRIPHGFMCKNHADI